MDCPTGDGPGPPDPGESPDASPRSVVTYEEIFPEGEAEEGPTDEEDKTVDEGPADEGDKTGDGEHPVDEGNAVEEETTSAEQRPPPSEG